MNHRIYNFLRVVVINKVRNDGKLRSKKILKPDSLTVGGCTPNPPFVMKEKIDRCNDSPFIMADLSDSIGNPAVMQAEIVAEMLEDH